MQGYDCAHIWFNIAAAGENNVMAKKREMAQRKMTAQPVKHSVWHESLCPVASQRVSEQASRQTHALSKQLGNSVAMIERYYSKLTATMAAERLA